MSARSWNREEEDYLEEHWGIQLISLIAKHLKRSEDAIVGRTQKLNLGPSKDRSGFLVAGQLAKAIHVDLHTITDHWIPKHGLKAIRKATKKTLLFWCIELPDFWEWAENHQSKLDSRRFECGALGPEPEWMASKRETDLLFPPHRMRIWKPAEDRELLILAASKKFTQQQIAGQMGQTHSSIEHRFTRLKGKIKNMKDIGMEMNMDVQRTTHILETLHDFDFRDLTMPFITVYQHPIDMPDKFVARVFNLDKPTPYALVKDTLEEIRQAIPDRFANIGRTPTDEPQIYEVWI